MKKKGKRKRLKKEREEDQMKMKEKVKMLVEESGRKWRKEKLEKLEMERM